MRKLTRLKMVRASSLRHCNSFDAQFQFNTINRSESLIDIPACQAPLRLLRLVRMSLHSVRNRGTNLPITRLPASA